MKPFKCPHCDSIPNVTHLIQHRSCDYCGRDLTLEIQELFQELYRPPSAEADVLLKIVMSHLQEGSWDTAIAYAKSVLAIAPRFPIAYLYIFMARHRVFALSQLSRRRIIHPDPYYELFRETSHPFLVAQVDYYIHNHESGEDVDYYIPSHASRGKVDYHICSHACREEVHSTDPEYEYGDSDDVYFNREPGMIFIHLFRVILALGLISLVFLVLSQFL